MECPYFEYTNGTCFNHMGRGTANMITYLAKGFREWQLYGFVKDESELIGYPIDGIFILPVYGAENITTLQSDADPKKEQKQIDEGKTAILCFYGPDNCSYMRRITPEEFKNLRLTRYFYKETDLFYNS